MPARELAKSVSLTLYRLTILGRARGSFLSLKQPTDLYGYSTVAPK